jgi:SpoVK/Ycf46/Vps4 family AAA+-type ATPase
MNDSDIHIIITKGGQSIIPLPIDNSLKRIFSKAFEEPPPRKKKPKTHVSWKYGLLVSLAEIKSLDDLLTLAWNYKGDHIIWFKLWNIIPALTELKNVIGMDDLKMEVVRQIMYIIRNYNHDDYFHTVLYGPPGVGKTMIAHILAKIYAGLGIVGSEKVTHVKRSDLIGEYVGKTEKKTKDILNKAKGGILFLDEAYAMGHQDKTDVFSKACIDQINQFLSEHKHEMIMIIAGYEKEIEQNFFGINKGLASRFQWKFTLKGYSYTELHAIFVNKAALEGWMVPSDSSFFKDHVKEFPYHGRDVENFFSKCKVAKACIINSPNDKVLTMEHLHDGFKLYKPHTTQEDVTYLGNYI